MLIMVDSNEQATNPKVLEHMRKTFPELQITNLQFGDVNVILEDGSILAIERKRANDFLASIGDGRVFRQVEQMHEGAKWYCIVIEGGITFTKDDMTIVDGRETEWHGASVRGALFAIQWSGCPVLVTDKNHYPQIVAELIRFCSKPEIHWQELGHHRIVTFPPIEMDLEILSAFPGVGLKKARALQEFAQTNNDNGVGTLAESLCWATAFTLIDYKQRPSGWSDRLVANIRAMLGLAPWEFLDIKEDKKLKEKYNGKK